MALPSGERRRLSNGRSTLPWLSEKQPTALNGAKGLLSSGQLISSEDNSAGALDRRRSSLNAKKQSPKAKKVLTTPSLSLQPDPVALQSRPRAPSQSDDDLSPTAKPKRARRAPPVAALGISRAVTDLERLMREAVQVAIQAAEQGRDEDVRELLQDTTDAVHHASVSTRAPPLTVDSDSEEDTKYADAVDHGHDSAVGIQTLPLPVTVEHTPILPRTSQAKLLSTEPGKTAPLPSEREASAVPAVSEPTGPAAHDNMTDTLDWTRTGAHGITTRDPGPNPWAPKHANTLLLGNPLRAANSRRQTANPLDVNDEDFVTPRRATRRLRNPNSRVEALAPNSPQKGSRTRHGFSLGHHSRRQPIARKWSTWRKRFVATIACINTGFAGYVIGVYAGEVPRIQYQVVDPHHYIILGNVILYLGLAVTTFLFWPLPLLHGRKPYTVGAFALVLPLQFPQAVVVSSVRAPDDQSFRVGLLLSRLFTGLALGLANINCVTTLLDLFGASLQSSNPHQELVMLDDVRRQGGGMGIWLGMWSWCFIGSIALGFLTGAGIIAHLNPQWGFYITCIVGLVVLLLNVLVPETRRSPYRRSFTEFVDDDEKMRRRIARGEVKLHLKTEGPLWWGQEVWAGLRLNFKMLFQWGFFVLAFYLGWAYALVVLVIVLLGSLLSRDYGWRPQYVGLGVFAIGIGALLAVPLSKAGLFSRDRTKGPRTDTMTFERQVTWTSHAVRRVIFMLVLPLAGIAYTLSSPGDTVHWILPILFAGFVGFLANLGIAECVGIVMETFDTSDLQPGANSRHRFKSMASNVRRRRTNYSSFPRVTAGIFVSQSIGFLLAAAATGVGGVMTRSLGSQTATAITAAILMLLTVLLTLVLWRFRHVQVIPNHAFGTRVNTFAWDAKETDDYWKPVVIGNPSGKMRRMSVLELGYMSRWTEIRLLNKLIKPKLKHEGTEWAAG